MMCPWAAGMPVLPGAPSPLFRGLGWALRCVSTKRGTGVGNSALAFWLTVLL